MDEFSINKHRSIHSQFRNGLGQGMFAKLSQSIASNKSPNDQIIIFEINQISYCISGFHRKSLQKDKKKHKKDKTRRTLSFLYGPNSSFLWIHVRALLSKYHGSQTSGSLSHLLFTMGNTQRLKHKRIIQLWCLPKKTEIVWKNNRLWPKIQKKSECDRNPDPPLLVDVICEQSLVVRSWGKVFNKGKYKTKRIIKGRTYWCVGVPTPSQNSGELPGLISSPSGLSCLVQSLQKKYHW